MKGVIIEKVGGNYEVVDNLEKPHPDKGQVLVKSLATGLNPMEAFMQSTGLFVMSWPIVLGCDASGTVVAVGEDVTKFKVGDGIFGCTRLGFKGYMTFQEYFLMDEHLAFKRPSLVTVEQAATIGVGLLTAALALVSGSKIKLEHRKCNDDSKWVIVLGAAGAVGQFAVQVAKLCGFKVLGSCSPANSKVVESVGADATFNYKIPLEDQIKEIGRITGGKFSRVFDASALAGETGMAALAASTAHDEDLKYFATVNDWTPIEPKEGIEIYMVRLGQLGRYGNTLSDEVNENITALIPKLEKYLENGDLKPMEYKVVGEGFEGVLKGLEVFNSSRTAWKKCVVRLQAD